MSLEDCGDAKSILFRSLAAGAVAGCTVDIVLFPLDSIKTRLQAIDGKVSPRNLQKLYSGLPVVMIGNSIGSSVFFATYEETKSIMSVPDGGCWEAILASSCSAALGELVACTVRTPTEILKQRMQAQQVTSLKEGIKCMNTVDVAHGFRATASRDLVFSAIQYPAYEYLKFCVSENVLDGSRELCAWESAICGSVTGFTTAFITTPLDVVKTRVMLGRGDCSGDGHGGASRGGVIAQIAHIQATEGARGLFHGALCRGLWMGLGGLLFLGSYEQAKALMKDDSPSRQKFVGRYAWSRDKPPSSSGEVDNSDSVSYRRCWYVDSAAIIPGGSSQREFNEIKEELGHVGRKAGSAKRTCPAPSVGSDPFRASEPLESKASQNVNNSTKGGSRHGVAAEMLAGGIAGCAVDVSMHPIDTLKTRLQAPKGFWDSGGLANIWRGVSVSCCVSVPASAVFWAVYAPLKQQLREATGSNTKAEVIAGPVSEMASLLVRVPSEVLKQRMQAGIHKGRLLELVHNIRANEGLFGFYAGFAATCFRSLPFALIQFPVYEELKRQMEARGFSGNAWGTGAACGAMAGGFAAAITSPLDLVKTRIMLAPPEARYGFLQTASLVCAREGFSSLFSGVLPRSIHLSFGGMVYLGVYNGVADYLQKV